MKKYTFLFIIFILLICQLSFISAGHSTQNSKIDSKVYSAFEKDNKIKVVISLDSKPQSFTALKFAVRIEDKLQGRIISRYKNNIIASISKSELESFESDQRIKKIYYPREIKAFLQDSVPLINASLVWPLQVNSTNITGSYETVCVIDTGINFTHPDLIGKNKTCVIDCYNKTCIENCSIADNNGHGTHVAGIIAASGGINGVGSSIGLIGVKILDSNGDGSERSETDLPAAIDWCVNNSQYYNISVISMSLGTATLYEGDCGSVGDSWTDAINNATSKNVSVIAASGNSGPGIPRNTTAISAPACIANVTAVSATNKNDAIASYAHYNSQVELVAPGTDINSTMIYSPTGNILSSCGSGKSYCPLSGTSMAAPHVAAAFALIRQFYRLQTGRVYTTQQIKNALKNHGENITSPGGLNFTRINVYSAIISLDSQAPAVSLILPSNNTSTLNPNVTFRCNASDLSLKNATFYFWNSSAEIVNQTSRNVSGQTNTFEINISNISAGSYKWNCFYSDYDNSIGYSPVNYTLSITNIETTLSLPLNNLFTNQNQTFTCNATSASSLQNASFYIWNSSSSLVNMANVSASGISSSSNFSFNFTYDSGYFWNCLYTDINNIKAFASSNFSITYDSIPPSINVTSPLNTSWQNIGRFNLSLNENGTCLYSLNNGELNYTLTSSNNRDFNATNLSLIDNQTYYVKYYCNDTAGNLNITSHFAFNTEMSSPNISLISPSNGYSASGSTLDVTFEYNVTDGLNISSCSLILNSAVSLTNTTIENKTASHSFTKNLASASYTWSINCIDLAGNIGGSSSRTLTITAPASQSYASSSSGSSGGGGGGTPTSSTYSPTSEQLSSGYKPELKKEDKVKIILFDEISQNHTLIMESVTSNSVNITIRSAPINFLLGIGQSIKLNLTSPKYYNLLVRLDEIKEETGKSKRALLTIQSLREDIPQKDSDENKNISAKKEDKITAQPIREIPTENKFDNYKLKALYASWAVFIFVLAGLIVHWIDLRKEKKKKR